MTILHVPCKQTRIQRAAGSKFPQALNKVMGMHLYFLIFSSSICMYIESKAGDLGPNLIYNNDSRLTGRRKPNGTVPC